MKNNPAGGRKPPTARQLRYGQLVRLNYHVRTTHARAEAIEQAQQKHGLTKTQWFEMSSDLLLAELAPAASGEKEKTE